MPDGARRPLPFIASSLTDLRGVPVVVRGAFGRQLLDAQYGDTPASAKPLKGFGGASVLELVEDDHSSTYRAVYTVRFERAVYVLHVFQKKSTKGIATSKGDMDLVSVACNRRNVTMISTMVGSRLRRRIGMPRESSTVRRAASTRHAGHHGGKSTHVDEASVTTVGPNDNVFAALTLPEADEWLAKAELARAIQRLIGTLGLTQIQAAAALGGAQSDISNLARGRLAGYSMERLYRFLNALGQDVRIVVRPKPRTRPQATVRALVRKTA